MHAFGDFAASSSRFRFSASAAAFAAATITMQAEIASERERKEKNCCKRKQILNQDEDLSYRRHAGQAAPAFARSLATTRATSAAIVALVQQRQL